MKFIGTFFDLCKKLIKNGGMESVTSLPTTNNFEGREVNFKGTKYIYYNGAWVNQRDAEKLGGLDSSLYITNPKETVIGESSYEIYGENSLLSKSYIDNLYSPLMYASPDNFTIEYSDDGEVFTEIEKTDPIYNIRFYSNSSYYIKFTTHPYYRITVPFNATLPIRNVFYALVLKGFNYYIDRCLIEELQGEAWNVIADERQNNYSPSYYAVEFKSHYLYPEINSRYYCQSLRVTLKGRHISNNTSYGVNGIALLSNYSRDLSGIRNYFRSANGILSSPFSLDSQETLNYDINNIKPTQTGTVKKSSSWIWQYLVQSVNWLRDNSIPKRSHEHIYLNCDWLYIGRTSVTGAIILKTPFQNIGDVNNSMTYIELSVIAHTAPTRVAKYIFYVYKYQPTSSSYEQKYYSVLGPQIFSNIYIGALQDNSTVIVLGDFTDTYKFFTVSIDRVVTSFNRTSDDTDKFSLYVESDESVLQYKAKFNLQSAFAKGYAIPDGTDSQFLKADGSVDNNKYVTKTHTHNGADAEKIDYANLKNKPDIPEAITVDSALSATSTNPVQNKKVYAALQDKADLVASAYNYTNGYLVKTDIAASVEGPIYIHIYGLSRYNASPINTEIALYNTSSGITQSYGIHYGMNFGNIHVFHYNDYVYFWFAQSQTYQVFYFEVYTSGTNATTNHIIGYANGAKPTSGTTHEITVIPIQVSYNNHSHDGTGTPKIDYNDLENKPTIYTSATINGVNVDFSADNNNIPSYITFDTVLYPFRFTGTAFQIYRNDVWVDILNIGNLLTDGSGVITTDNVDWWFDPTIREYYIEQSVIVSLLTKKFPLGKPTTIDWSNVVINTGGLSISLTGGKSTALLAQLKENLSNVFGGEGFNFYTEYDIAAMIDSGVGFKLKIELNRYTDSNGNNVNDVIVECYQIWR